MGTGGAGHSVKAPPWWWLHLWDGVARTAVGKERSIYGEGFPRKEATGMLKGGMQGLQKARLLFPVKEAAGNLGSGLL